MVYEPLPIKRQQSHSQGRSATKAKAEDVVDMLAMIDKNDRLPRFFVQSDDLTLVLHLRRAVSIDDEHGARLEALESSHRKDMNELKRMVNNIAMGQVKEKTHVPTFPLVRPVPHPLHLR